MKAGGCHDACCRCLMQCAGPPRPAFAGSGSNALVGGVAPDLCGMFCHLPRRSRLGAHPVGERGWCGDVAAPAPRIAMDRCAFSHRFSNRVFPGRRESRCCLGKFVRYRLRPARRRAAARPPLLSSVPSRHESCRACRRCLHLPGFLGIHVAFLLGACDGASP